MSVVIYVYGPCSTCRDALRWLDRNKIDYDRSEITETPPTIQELQAMLVFQGGQLTRLFNVSGLEYRALNLKTRLPAMSRGEAFNLLSSRGKLVKRPFLLAKNFGLLGFNPADWQERLAV